MNELGENQFRFFVSRLSGTYSAIPVSKVAADLGGTEEEVTAYIQTLIAGGLLNARIERTSREDLGVILRFFLDRNVQRCETTPICIWSVEPDIEDEP